MKHTREAEMDGRTMIVLLAAIAVVGAAVFFIAQASVARTKTQADASVARAQEHTRRAEGRHDLMNFLGLIRGRKEP